MIRQMDELQLDKASTEVPRHSKDDAQIPRHNTEKSATMQPHRVRKAAIKPLQHAQKASPDLPDHVNKAAPKAAARGEESEAEKLQLYIGYGQVSLGANLMGFSLAVWLGETTGVMAQGT